MQRECDHKLAALGPNASKEGRSEVGILYRANAVYLEAHLTAKMQEIQKVYGPSIAFNKLAYCYFDFTSHTGTKEDDLQRLFEYMHWERHGESLRKTSDAVGEGDIPALRRVHRTDEDRLKVLGGCLSRS